VNLGDTIKRLFKRRPPTEEELAARAERKAARERALDEAARQEVENNAGRPY
jgi:hypothetical protein